MPSPNNAFSARFQRKSYYRISYRRYCANCRPLRHRLSFWCIPLLRAAKTHRGDAFPGAAIPKLRHRLTARQDTEAKPTRGAWGVAWCRLVPGREWLHNFKGPGESSSVMFALHLVPTTQKCPMETSRNQMLEAPTS